VSRIDERGPSALFSVLHGRRLFLLLFVAWAMTALPQWRAAARASAWPVHRLGDMSLSWEDQAARTCGHGRRRTIHHGVAHRDGGPSSRFDGSAATGCGGVDLATGSGCDGDRGRGRRRTVGSTGATGRESGRGSAGCRANQANGPRAPNAVYGGRRRYYVRRLSLPRSGDDAERARTLHASRGGPAETVCQRPKFASQDGRGGSPRPPQCGQCRGKLQRPACL
jgi:hypothetical protein